MARKNKRLRRRSKKRTRLLVFKRKSITVSRSTIFLLLSRTKVLTPMPFLKLKGKWRRTS
jgi:hypothetical protein